MKYLYTGDDSPDGWAEARRRILADSGREIRSIGFNPYFRKIHRRFGNLQMKLGTGPAVWSYNRDLIRAARELRPDIFWIDKGSQVQAETIREVKRLTGAVVANFNTDHLACAKHPWRLHMEGIPEYDFYFTSNTFDMPFLRERGVPNVVFAPLGYYAKMFGPVTITEVERRSLGAEVGFIGHWEEATEKLVLELLDRGLPLRIRGQSWKHARNKERLQNVVEHAWISQADYQKCVLATKINLGIISVMNRNQTAGRSFEIPASGGFLLAKRTEEHLALFEEGKEAEFWDDADELARKARYYLEHDDERRAIAEAGHRRLLASGTSFEEMVPRLADQVEAEVRRRRG